MCTGFVSLMLICSAAWALAQAPADPMTAVAPYIDGQTMAVFRMDLARIDVSELAKRVSSLAGVDQSDRDTLSMFEHIAQLRAAGATVVYSVFAGEDVFPVVVIPLAGGADAARIQAAVRAVTIFSDLQAEQRGNVLVLAMPASWKHMKALQPSARPDLAAALSDGKDAEIAVAIGLGSDFRRAAEETMPKLPENFGGGASTAITRGLKWASIQIRTTPKFDVTANVQAADADSARKLEQIWQAWAKSMTQPPIKESGEQVLMHAATKMAAMQISGDKLIIRLSEAMMQRDLPTLRNRARIAANRSRTTNNLRQLALALHSYHDATGKFPTDIYDKNGKPLLSWRVQILPYLEQAELAKAIRMDEPWDSEHNKKFLAEIPKVFDAPGQKSAAGTTTYLTTIGEKFFLAPQPNGQARGIRDIVDGTSMTIMVVEAADEAAVPWTKPGDLTPTEKDPIKGLVGHYPDGFYTAFCDGSVRFLPSSVDLKDLYGMYTINGGEVIKQQ